jgi:hypothetical protein
MSDASAKTPYVGDEDAWTPTWRDRLGMIQRSFTPEEHAVLSAALIRIIGDRLRDVTMEWCVGFVCNNIAQRTVSYDGALQGKHGDILRCPSTDNGVNLRLLGAIRALKANVAWSAYYDGVTKCFEILDIMVTLRKEQKTELTNWAICGSVSPSELRAILDRADREIAELDKYFAAAPAEASA